VAIGVLLIGGVLGVLWAEFGPRDPEPEARAVPELEGARATVELRDLPLPGQEAAATIECDGDDRTATGYWADDPLGACEALASTRGALTSGPGCAKLSPDRARMTVTGAFEGREFSHRAQRGGCPDPDGWLAVNALAGGLVPPDRELEGAPEP
jgi:hypothetical protein